VLIALSAFALGAQLFEPCRDFCFLGFNGRRTTFEPLSFSLRRLRAGERPKTGILSQPRLTTS
jgi:hypothetical protein